MNTKSLKHMKTKSLNRLNTQTLKHSINLLLLEIINLVAIGLSCYNFSQHVASDIGVRQLYLPSENNSSQSYMNSICKWTEENKMQLNEEKSKVMIFKLPI